MRRRVARQRLEDGTRRERMKFGQRADIVGVLLRGLRPFPAQPMRQERPMPGQPAVADFRFVSARAGVAADGPAAAGFYLTAASMVHWCRRRDAPRVAIPAAQPRASAAGRADCDQTRGGKEKSRHRPPWSARSASGSPWRASVGWSAIKRDTRSSRRGGTQRRPHAERADHMSIFKGALHRPL